MEHRPVKPDIGEVGVFCRVCHRWNDGQTDLCSHCGERLVGDRPLSSGSVASWVEGQVDERNTLGIPVSGGDRYELHEWASFDPASRIAEPDADDTGRLVARAQGLMTEFGLSKRKAWLTARLELGIPANPPNFLGYERIDERPALSRPSVAVRLKRLINPPPFVGYDRSVLRIDDHVFTAPAGAFLRRSNFRRRVWLPAVRATVSLPCTFHDLRHSHAALLIDQGEHPKLIQARFGHESIRITMDTYGHLFDDMDRAAADLLDETLTSATAGQARDWR